MSRATLTGHRATTAGVLVVAGGALAVATWVGGEHGLAIGLVVLYAVAATAAYLWSGRDTDVAAIMRAGGDERQRRIDRDATAVAGLAMIAVAIVGAVVSAARDHGNVGAYGVMCAVGGTAYAISLVVLRRRS
jgi:hypothetical protein